MPKRNKKTDNALEQLYINRDSENFYMVENGKLVKYTNPTSEANRIMKIIKETGLITPPLKERLERAGMDVSDYKLVNYDEIIIRPSKKDELDLLFSQNQLPPLAGVVEEPLDEGEEEAKVTVDVAQVEDIEETDLFEKYKDDYVQALTEKGYSERERNGVLEMMKDMGSIDEILQGLLNINKNEDVISLGEIFDTDSGITESQFGSMDNEFGSVGPELGYVGPDVDLATGNLASDDTATTDDTVIDDVEEPTPKLDVGTGGNNEKLPYIKRYHETSILLYFNNSSFPDWDLVLEKNVLSLDITSKERVEIMDDILMEYGPKMFISKRKSDTLKELNELIQLQFCIMRNLHIGSRTKTASVKLDDLIKIDKLANGNSSPAIVGTIGNSKPLITSGGLQSVQTKREYDSIINNDNLQRARALSNGSANINKKVTIIKTGYDHNTHGILPGNNFNATQTVRIPKKE